MTRSDILDDYGALAEDATLTIRRLLPGPIERVWSYLTEDDLRRQWLAAGPMEMAAGAPFEFVWRNDGLGDPPSRRPEGFPEETRLESRIVELDPPSRLSIEWGRSGGVTLTLEPKGAKVLLTLVHRRLPDRSTVLNVSAGWHTHLDILEARMTGRPPKPFWESWSRLKGDYERRIPDAASPAPRAS